MKMKRYVSLLMAVALLICTGAIQVAVAASFTEPFFYDFEDCTATGSYGVLGGSWDDPSTAAQIDEEHGKSLVYTTKATHLNINGETTKNTIIGFSAYTNNSAKTSWRLVLKNAAVTDNIIERKYGNLNFIGGITQTDEDGWKNFTVGFDYETHRITVWMNGEKFPIIRQEKISRQRVIFKFIFPMWLPIEKMPMMICTAIIRRRLR